MYLYFNNQGVLKEIVNDEAIRQGNSRINKIRFFIEGAEPQIVNNVYKALTFITGVRTFIDVEGNPIETVDIDNNTSTTEQFSLETEKLTIPYNKKRELKFFKYFTKYEMFSITVPDDVLNINGTVGCRIQMVSAEGITTLGLIVFNVEGTGTDAVISPDTAINIAQWNYLIENMTTPEKFVVKYNVDANEWDIVPTQGSTRPVTSGGIYTAIANALSAVYKIMGSSDVSSLNDLTKSVDMNGYVYNMTDAGSLNNEDSTTVSVQIGDNVVFCWNNGDWYWDKLSGIVDTSNLVTTDTNQNISGIKTFTSYTNVSEFRPTTGTIIGIRANLRSAGQPNDIGTDEYPFKDLFLNEKINFSTSGVTTLYHLFENASEQLEIGRTYNNIYAALWLIDGRDFVPKGDNENKIGSSNKRISTVYTYGIHSGGGNFTLQVGSNIEIYCNQNAYMFPNQDGYLYLGKSNKRFSCVYTSSIANDFSALQIRGKSGINFQCDNGSSIRPSTNGQLNLGSSDAKWNYTYTNYISNGTTNISVNDIATKVDTTDVLDLGTFDANGEITIAISDLEDALYNKYWGTELHGMYMLTYLYAQAIIYLDETQIATASAAGHPVRAPMPVVYDALNSYSVPGNIRVKKVGTDYVFKVSDGNLNAAQGQHLYLISTNLIK